MSLIQHFELNTKGRDFIFGDLHGSFKLLEQKLKEVNFEASKDRLFSVGDLVDRGPESERVLEFNWVNFVRGNHEQMAIDWYNGDYTDRYNYSYNGGSWFIDTPREYQKLVAYCLEEKPLVIEVETTKGLIGIVHAEIPMGYDWYQVKEELEWSDPLKNSLMWNRIRVSAPPSEVEGVTKIFSGHTILKEPILLGNSHFIDTGAYYTGNLTFMEITEGL